MDLPIIFFHKGKQKYLLTAIRRAMKSGNDVCLLGDENNSSFCNNWIDVESLNTPLVESFKACYVHMSTNPYEFELICILRYFYLYELMVRSNIDKVILVDSDCLVYERYVTDDFAHCDVSIGWEERKDGFYLCPGYSFWTQDALRLFVNYCLELYTNGKDILQTEWEKVQGKPGGICDMTLLLLWVQSKPLICIDNFCEREDKLFICIPDIGHDKKQLYKYNNFTRLLDIEFIDHKPYLLLRDGGMQGVDILHMHGGKKVYMKLLDKYRTGGISFFVLEFYRRLKIRLVKRYVCLFRR